MVLSLVHRLTSISPLTALTRVPAWVAAQATKHRDARSLAEMSDDQLRDIGLSRDDATREALRLGWTPPEHWTRRR